MPFLRDAPYILPFLSEVVSRMPSQRRVFLSLICFYLGIGAVTCSLGRLLYAHAAGGIGFPTNDTPLVWLLGGALVAGITALAIAVFTLTGATTRSWKAGIGLTLGLSSVGIESWHLIQQLTPRLSIDDLLKTRDRAMPVIEKITGYKFKAQVPVTFEFDDAVRKSHSESLRRDFDKPAWEMPVEFLGLYDQDTKAISIMPDAVGRMQRTGRLRQGSIRDVARAILVDELVHALDHQNGHMESRQALDAMRKQDINQFLIRRAIHEGHAAYVSKKTCINLGIPTCDDLLFSDEVLPTASDTLSQGVTSAFRFIYNEGTRFFTHLDNMGREDLVRRALGQAPRWTHYIQHPDIYARDTDAGMSDVLDRAISSMPRIFDASLWSPSLSNGWRLREDSGAVLLDELRDDSFNFGRSPVSLWMGGYSLNADSDCRIIVFLWRFPDAPAAASGLEARVNRLKQDHEGLSFTHIEPSGVERYLCGVESNGKGTREFFHDLAQSGEFLLYSSGSLAHDSVHSELFKAMLREILVPCGQAKQK